MSHFCMEHYCWLSYFFVNVDNLKCCDYYLLDHLSLRKTTVSVNILGKQDSYKGKHTQTATFVQIIFSLYPKICSEIRLGVGFSFWLFNWLLAS